MVIEVFFVITATVAILCACKVLSFMGSVSELETPYISSIYVLYPSIGFQVWFWSDKFLF